ncbi:ATP-binding protein [Methanococcoides methylutens]|nr:ATP-binding protein [Methanococcoides methylutens]
MAYQQSIELTKNYANYFDGNARTNQGIVKTISTAMSNYDSADRDEVNDMLKGILLENPQLVGVYVGYEPNAFDGKDAEFIGEEGHDETGRFIPFWNRINGLISVEPLVDYETSEYYQLPKKLKQTVVIEPYFYRGILMVSYDSPIIRNGEFVGISGVDVSLEYFDEVVSNIDAFETGYAFVTSNSGMLLSHPEHKEWIGTKTLNDFGVPEISEMATDIKEGKSGYIETMDPDTGREIVMFYEPINEGTYSFVLCAPKDEMLAGVTILRNRLIFMSLFSIILVGGIAYMISRSTDQTIKKMLNDFKLISDNALTGNFDTRADTNVQVDFKKIPLGLNQMLDNMNKLTKSNEKAIVALQRSESKFKSFFNNSNDPIIIYDSEGTILEVNEVACEFTGYSRDEILSMTLKDLDSSEYASKVSDSIKQLHEDGHAIFESMAIRKDGTPIPIETSNRIIEYAGKPAIISTARDIREHQNAVEAMLKAKLAAEDASRAKSEFISNMSHELRTPLTLIIGFSDILSSENYGSLNEDQKKYISNVLRHGNHLLELINDLLDLSNIESGKMEVQINEFFVSDAIDEVEALMVPIASKKDIDLTSDIDIKVSTIKADMQKFKQILYNLLSNAIKFTDEGGSVTIEGKVSEDFVHISVKDSGIGISPEDQDKLFNHFYQVDSSTTRDYEGTGLGLALVKKFVEMHDGEIWVESEVGNGSTFTFAVPIEGKVQ